MLTVSIQDNFTKTFKDYLKYTSRTLEESVLQHSYYIARNAVNTTGAAKKGQIRRDLEAPSRNYPKAQLVNIIINKSLGKGRGLYGAAMQTASDEFIKRRQQTVNFLRSGWLPAVKKLAALVKSKGGRSLKGTKQHGRDKGGAYVHKSAWTPFVELWNDVAGGKKPSARVHAIKQAGASEAIELERQSMLSYIRRKQSEAADRFNRGIGQLLFG